MSRETQPDLATPIEVLVTWANDQQHWVRAAVSEILRTRQRLSAETLDGIYQMSLVERGLRDGTPSEVPKLGSETSDSNGEERLELTSLREVERVNVLAPGQEIQFNPRLTLLYGENASGKSGYVRILKRVAAVRSAEPILGNIHQPSEEPPHAVLGYRLGDQESNLEWNNEQGVPPFTRISIFDSRASAIHLDQNLTYVYTPRDLALFPLVTDAIHQIRDRLARERDAAQPSGNPFLPHFEVGTPLYAKVETLGASTDLTELDALADVTPEEEARRESLQRRVDALRPGRVSDQLQLCRSRRSLYGAIQGAAHVIRGFDFSTYAEGLRHFKSAEARYQQATQEALAGTDIPGVLTDAWRGLVVAGGAYLSDLGRDDYPRKDDKCIYCRQDLTEAALDLLRKYQDYCNSDLKATLDAARERFHTLTDPVISLDLDALGASITETLEALPEGAAPPPLLAKAAELVRGFSLLRSRVVASEEVEAGDFPTVAGEVESQAGAEVASADEMIAKLTQQHSEREREYNQARTELRDLDARLTLKRLMPQIREHVGRAKWASRASSIISDRTPPLLRSLTEASKVASEDFLNQDFARRFEEERRTLRGPEVRLEFPGRSGQAQRKKSLPTPHRLSDVLSEGEQKVIAIADFLAEVATRTTPAPLVFDDPVSSFDYRRLNEIVDRIEALSRDHQVVVFTHNIWFASALLAKFDRRQGECSFYNVCAEESALAGVVEGGNHPRQDTPRKLGGRINAVIQEAEGAAGETRRALVESGYSLVRSWCETVVEQELLQGVTQRYQPNVMMTKLRQIRTGRLQAAIDVIYPLFEKACRITEAHSQPLETSSVAPTLQELREDWRQAQEVRQAYME